MIEEAILFFLAFALYGMRVALMWSGRRHMMQRRTSHLALLWRGSQRRCGKPIPNELEFCVFAQLLRCFNSLGADIDAQALLNNAKNCSRSKSDIAAGTIVWPQAMVMTAGSIVGGYSSAHFSQKLPQTWVKSFVILVGSAMTIYFFIRAYR